MHTRYSIFAPYYGSYASQYEEDVIRLLSVIQCLNPETHITFAQLDCALIHTGLSPDLLYQHASSGKYTAEMARFDEALGLAATAIHAEEVTLIDAQEAMHVMQLLIDEAKPKPLPPLSEPTKPERKAPYYQRNKQQWWK